MLKAFLCTAVITTAMAGGAWAQSSPTTPSSPSSPPAESATPPSSQPDRSPPAAREPSTKAPASSTSSGSMSTTMTTGPAHPIVGDEVKDSKGESVGKISDVLVGPDGKVEKVVLSVGGVLGVGGKSVAVGWDQLKVDPTKDTAMITMSKDQIEAAPEYKRPSAQHGSGGDAGKSR